MPKRKGDDTALAQPEARQKSQRIIDRQERLQEALEARTLSAAEERQVEAFVRALQTIIAPSNAAWLKKAKKGKTKYEEPILGGGADANDTERMEIQRIGTDLGCHTCNSKLEKGNQPWIGDHIPPTELLHDPIINVYKPPSPQRLYPQCDRCARVQSWLVKKLQATTGKAPKLDTPPRSLTDHAPSYLGHNFSYLALIVGGAGARYVRASNPKSTSAEALDIQELGEKYGCHSCGSRQASYIYIADHYIPVGAADSHIITIVTWLNATGRMDSPTAEELTNRTLRPQCSRCSTKQGGGMGNLANMARDLGTMLGIPVISMPGAR